MITLNIITHSGDQDRVEIEDYDAQVVASDLNDNTNEHVIVLGNNIYSKIDIKSIKPVSAEEVDS
ncbi:hypothetical protein [Alkalibacterium sp. MB6]|uniref:hypothetical protein n=1 Tax=Alkalibacterium sp. MB6 TaxID=2081965 RepID=UPI00137B7DD0|nr:hypothetical protein [Alkalibacterium sp. MB6]